MELLTLQPLFWLITLVAVAIGLRFSLVDQPPWRRAASTACRALGIAALILALCRPYLLTPSDRLHVVFLVDVSESVDLDSLASAAATIRDAIDNLGSTDSWSLVAAGAETRALPNPGELSRLVEQWRQGTGDQRLRAESRLAEAMLAARLEFPAGRTRRMVLLSDGRSTEPADAVADALDQLAEERVDVRLAPLAPLQQAEAAVVAIEPATPSAFQGEVIRLRVTVRANRDMAARVRVNHRGVAEQTKPVKLIAGEPKRVDFDVEARTAGPARYTAELLPAEDYFPLNNQLSCSVTVRGEPRVLALHTDPRRMRPLSRAMSRQGIALDVRGRRGMPATLEEVLAFDAVVLADLPATDLTARQMEVLKRYVIDYGGGLAMLGSENSFGLGGYFKTPVEEVLPLISRFEKEKEKPSIAMMLVIDTSGSMGGDKIALARQAGKATVELLAPRDRIGVVAFASSAQVVCDLRSASDRVTIQSAVDSLSASGGTNMYPGMASALEILKQASAKVRLMIVLGDGQTTGGDFVGLARDAVNSKITISTVALGEGADRASLAAIAEAGGGRYYETTDPTNVPQIFTKETLQASKSAIKEDLFAAVQTADHPMLAGFSDSQLPLSLGYIMTEAKPTAQQLLAAETGDPLLAVGRYGLGTGLAFTSDLTERWGAEWLAWDGCGKFWAQVFRGLVRKQDTQGLSARGEADGEIWKVTVTRRDESRRPLNGLDWDAAATDGLGRKTPITVRQVGLGRYEAVVPLKDADRMSLRLFDSGYDKLKVLTWQRPYPAEYSLATGRTPSLAGLLAASAKDIRSDLSPEPRREPVSDWLYFVAIGLFVCGVFLRRI